MQDATQEVGITIVVLLDTRKVEKGVKTGIRKHHIHMIGPQLSMFYGTFD